MKPSTPSTPEDNPGAAWARLRELAPARHWRSLEQLASAPGFEKLLHCEFPPGAAEWVDDISRRHFLKLMGSSLALAGLTGCTKQPIESIIPYVRQPEVLTPGQPLFYATAMTMGGFATGLLVESHEGHPTKVEGNPEHPMSLGATHVFHQASILDLYDPDRSPTVLNSGQISSWESFLSALQDALLAQQRKQGAGLRLLTETVTSPTIQAQLRALLEKYPEARWHQYEPLTRDHVREGAKLAFGEGLETHYDFTRARIILSLDSDFLFAHPASLRYARQFAEGRRVSGGRKEMNRLYVAETTPSITGAKADHRLPLPARDLEDFARTLARRLGVLPDSRTPGQPAIEDHWMNVLAADLQRHPGASVVVAGEQQPPVVHALAHALNRQLGNVGTTISYTASAEARSENQLTSMRELVSALKMGQVDMLLILGGNPAFNAPADFDFGEQMAKARLRIHLSPEVNETSVLCQWHLPQKHYLESWGDARAFDGTVSLIQPLILPLYAGRSMGEIIDAVALPPGRGDYEITREYWKTRNIWPDFEAGWRRALHDGLMADTASPMVATHWQNPDLSARSSPTASGIEVSFRPDPTIGDGRFANNGWLQELAKPLTQLTWDNAALISPNTAQSQSLDNGRVIELELQGRKLRAPVWITPGQAENTVTLYLGYGRSQTGRVGQGTGFNAYGLRTTEAFWFGGGGKLAKTDRRYPLATTQTHHVIDSEERQILREGTLAEFLANPQFVRQSLKSPAANETLFNPEEHRQDGNRWGMSIDLTACIGCNACVLACQSENNIPVVGKDQVARGREMQWIRVDTYFRGDLANPIVTHQPVPCMQCENAPCELVCPVGATVHDHEGLNVQVYNRCIGTRYCSNNCPYKVRRFNFYQYADYATPSLEPLRNPNVTVRWRGVMEKCTYCLQRISAARIAAKTTDRPLRDGDVRTACQQVCPTEAIVFGDLADTTSRVSQLKARELDFSMLADLNTRPRTTYLARLRNPHPDLETQDLRAPVNPHA